MFKGTSTIYRYDIGELVRFISKDPYYDDSSLFENLYVIVQLIPPDYLDDLNFYKVIQTGTCQTIELGEDEIERA